MYKLQKKKKKSINNQVSQSLANISITKCKLPDHANTRLEPKTSKSAKRVTLMSIYCHRKKKTPKSNLLISQTHSRDVKQEKSRKKYTQFSPLFSIHRRWNAACCMLPTKEHCDWRIVTMESAQWKRITCISQHHGFYNECFELRTFRNYRTFQSH